MLFIARSENLNNLMFVGIKTNKLQVAVNAFKHVEGQMLRQIIIAAVKLMRATEVAA